jgi:outer membrane protein
MKNIYLIIMPFLLLFINANAQEINLQNLTLKKAIEIGLINSLELKSSKKNIDLANNTVLKQKKEWLPEIDATGNIKYNTQLQTMIIDGLGTDGQSSNLTIGSKNFTSFAIDLSQPIYKPGLIADIKIANNQVLLEKEKNNEKVILLKKNITEAFFNVIIKRQLYLKYQNNTLRKLEYFNVTNSKFLLKSALENDLLKTKLDLENSKFSEIEAKQNYDLAIQQLKYLLNVDSNIEITISENVDSYLKLEDSYSSSESQINRSDLNQLKIQYQSNILKLHKANSFSLPTISIVANYTNQYQTDDFKYYSKLWSPFNFVGLKMNLPITGNLKNVNSRKESIIKKEQDKILIEQKEKDIAYEILKFKIELSNANNSVIIADNNLKLSKEVFQTQLKMYQLGSVNYTSVLETENSLNTTEENYINAVYNFFIAKINFDKATNNL